MTPFSRSLVPLFLAFLFALPTLAEKPKFATVDVSRAFDAYYLTVGEKSRVRDELAKLIRDPRDEVIKLLKVEISDLKDQAQNPAISEAERTEYYRKHMMKSFEQSSLQRERDESVHEKRKVINEAMVKKMRQILDEVRAAVEKISVEGKFDYVFEKGGKTSSQIAPLIYIRNATDITDLVIEELNKNQPANPGASNTSTAAADTGTGSP